MATAVEPSTSTTTKPDFSGSWVSVGVENADAFMKAAGMGYMKRKMAASKAGVMNPALVCSRLTHACCLLLVATAVSPTNDIKQDGDAIELTFAVGKFFSKTMTFTVGTPTKSKDMVRRCSQSVCAVSQPHSLLPAPPAQQRGKDTTMESRWEGSKLITVSTASDGVVFSAERYLDGDDKMILVWCLVCNQLAMACCLWC